MTKGCEDCRLIPAGVSKRTGKSYFEFYACDNPKCPNFKPKTGEYGSKKVEGIDLVFDELQEFRKEFNDRMDSLAEYLAKKLL